MAFAKPSAGTGKDEATIVRWILSAAAIAAQLTCGDGATEPPADPNRAPEPVGAVPSLEVAYRDSVSVNPAEYFRDPDGDLLSFTALSSDAGIAAATVAGNVVTVRAASRGTATITVTATDPGGLSARQMFGALVPNRGPEADGVVADRRVDVGDTVAVGISGHFTDPEGDSLAFSAMSSDARVARAGMDGDSVLIAALAKGKTTVTVTARDPAGEAAVQSFIVTVPNRTPFVADTIPGDTVLIGDTIVLQLTAYFSDPDRDSLRFSAESSEPGVATVRVLGGTLTAAPVAPGRTVLTVTASDPEGLMVAQSFEVRAVHPNRAPVAVGTIRDRIIYLGESDSLDVSSYFSDPDGDSLTFTATTSRSIRVTVAVHESTLTLAPMSIGRSTITVTARDPDGLAATQRFRAEVEPVPVPDLVVDTPAVNADSVEVGGEFTLTIVVRNQGNREALSPVALRVYESFSSRITTSDREVARDSVMPLATGQASAVSVRVTGPSAAGIRFYGACIDALDTETDTGNNCSAGVPLAFWQPNRAPQPRDSIRAQTLEPGDSIRIGLPRYFTDPDRDSLRYTAESSDAAIAAVSVWRNSLTIVAGAVGSATVEVTAHDITDTEPRELTAAQSFEVTVRHLPRPDLVVELPVDSFAIGPQQSFRLNAVVRNEGILDAPSSATTVHFLRSSDTTIDTADGEIGTTSIGPLQVSAHHTASIGVTSPAAEGTYYYGACVEAVPGESRTDNNCSTAVTVVVDELRPPNRRPIRRGRFVDIRNAYPAELYRGPLAPLFSDPDGDPLTYTASSSDDAVAYPEVVRDSLYLFTVAPGTATVTITATDPGGLSATTAFEVTVFTPCTGFCIALEITGAVTDAQFDEIAAGVGTWQAILADTELPDVVLPEGFDCAGLVPSRRDVEGHLFLADVGPIDGPGGTLATAGYCARRAGTAGMPVVSRAIFDEADIDRLIALGMLADVAFHELAHGLGFLGGYFNRVGLLDAGADPHFTGSAARGAFDAAGGRGYTGAKVPLEGDLNHWRESVFDVEVMTPLFEAGVPQPISEITLAAFGDIGYAVDPSLTSDYRLPGTRPPLAAKGQPRQVFDLSGDVEQGPVTILGPDGHVARVIPPPPGYVPPLRSNHKVTIDVRFPRATDTVGAPVSGPTAVADTVVAAETTLVSWIREPYPALRRPGVPPRRPR